MKESLINLLKKLEISSPYVDYISSAIILLGLIVISYLGYIIFKPIFIKIMTTAAKKSKSHWDDVFLQTRFFHRLGLMIPALIIYISLPLILDFNPKVQDMISLGLEVYFIIIFIQILLSTLNAVNIIFDTTETGKSKSIKGYIQVVKIVLYFSGAILLFSRFSNTDPIGIFAGLGAFAAVLLFVFQDAIKGLVSGIQISSNDMVRIGDWVSMPKFDADGTVLDIALMTVKIQNWDKTIAMVPAYAFVSESFSNWRGMEESGGRRIKRSMFIDVNSIHFLSEEEKKNLKKIEIIRGYVSDKIQELENYNSGKGQNDHGSINGRRLTNIGVFRKYLEEYIRHNNNINHNMTFMVRQLQSSEKGLPIEIYAFSKVQSWIEYEAIQSDIFDHIYAAVNTFNLKMFQNPTGSDFQSLNR